MFAFCQIELLVNVKNVTPLYTHRAHKLQADLIYLHHQDNKCNYVNAIKKIVSVRPGTHTPKCYLVWVSGMGLIRVQGLDSKPHLFVNVRVHVHICAILSGSGARSGSKPHPNGEVRLHVHIRALLFQPIYLRIYHFNGGLEFELSVWS